MMKGKEKGKFLRKVFFLGPKATFYCSGTRIPTSEKVAERRKRQDNVATSGKVKEWKEEKDQTLDWFEKETS